MSLVTCCSHLPPRINYMASLLWTTVLTMYVCVTVYMYATMCMVYVTVCIVYVTMCMVYVTGVYSVRHNVYGVCHVCIVYVTVCTVCVTVYSHNVGYSVSHLVAIV